MQPIWKPLFLILCFLALSGCSLVRKDIDENDQAAQADRSSLIEEDFDSGRSAGVDELAAAREFSKEKGEEFDWDDPVPPRASASSQAGIPQGPPLSTAPPVGPTVPSAPIARPAANLPPAPREPALSSASVSPRFGAAEPNSLPDPSPLTLGGNPAEGYLSPGGSKPEPASPGIPHTAAGSQRPTGGLLPNPPAAQSLSASPPSSFAPAPPAPEVEPSGLSRAVRSSGLDQGSARGFTPSPPGALPPSLSQPPVDEGIVPPMPGTPQGFRPAPAASAPSGAAFNPTSPGYLQPSAAAAQTPPTLPQGDNLLISSGPARSDSAALPRPSAPQPAQAQQTPLPDADTLKQQGVDQYRRKEFGSAILTFRRYLANYPDNTQEVRWRLAQALLENDQWGEASKEFNELRGAPQPEYRADALLKLGLIDEKRGDAPSAQRQWRQVVDTYPNTEAAKRARKLLEASSAVSAAAP